MHHLAHQKIGLIAHATRWNLLLHGPDRGMDNRGPIVEQLVDSGDDFAPKGQLGFDDPCDHEDSLFGRSRARRLQKGHDDQIF